MIRSPRYLAPTLLMLGLAACAGREPMVMYLDTGERLTGTVATKNPDGVFAVRSAHSACQGRLTPPGEQGLGNYRIVCADGARGSGPLSGIGIHTGEGTLLMGAGRFATFRYGNAVR